MTKLLPHAGGHAGLMVHRVRIVAINAAEKAIHGVYAALIRCEEDYPGTLDFV